MPRWSQSPANRRRWRNFRSNRFGYWSLWIFSILLILSLFAEFIANDRPLLVSYKGEILAPVFVDYGEEKFGGFLAQTDYRDPNIAHEIEANGWMIWPPIHFSYNTFFREPPLPAPSPPTWLLTREQCAKAAEKIGADPAKGCAAIEWNWLGTDDQSRDVLARVIYGFRLSILFGLALTVLSTLIGVAAGAIQGYFGGATDLIFQRLIEIWGGLPTLYILIILSSFITPSAPSLLIILLATSWVAMTPIVRAEFLRARNLEYVKAAKALGLSDGAIIVKHILPNAQTATITLLPFLLNASIATLTSLDFLGFGLPSGSPSLGELLLQGKSHLEAPWLGLTSFAVIAVTLTLTAFIGDGLRDAYDQRKASS